MRFFLVVLFTNFLGLFAESSLTLKGSIVLAEKKNPYLIAETNKIEIAKAEEQTTKLLPNPTLNNQELFTTGNRSEDTQVFVNQLGTTVPIPGRPYPRFSRYNRQDWLQLTMKIPVAGQRTYAIQFAQKKLAITYQNLKEFKRNLFFLVANKWLDLWFSGKKIQFIKVAKNNTNYLLNINKVRLKNQVITKSEYNRTLILTEKYNVDFGLEKQKYRNELENLRLLVGDESIDSIDDKSNNSIQKKEKELQNYDTLVAYALKNRADIISNKLEQESAIANIKLQKAKAYPQPEVGLILNPQNGQEYIGTYLALPLPIFNRNQGGIRGAQAKLKERSELYFAMQWNVKKEIKNALGNFRVASSNYKKYKKIYKLSDNVLETVEYSYLKGGTTIIDYLQAQKNWYESQELLYNSIYTFQKSYLELLYVTGKINNYEEWND